MSEAAVVRADGSVLESVNSYLVQVSDVLAKLPVGALERMIHRLEEARWKRQQVFICGNGGSAATAIHFASDLSKGVLAVNKPPIRAESLCDNIALLTAWANDVSYDEIFAQRMAPWVKAGDVLIAISGSGNSRNVLRAVDLARAVGATTIGLTGFEGGKLKGMVDISITVPCDSMEQVEDIHLLLCHLITTCLRNIPSGLSELRMFPETVSGRMRS
jgi:D-sedoheptulose 7-phosphate isomerase